MRGGVICITDDGHWRGILEERDQRGSSLQRRRRAWRNNARGADARPGQRAGQPRITSASVTVLYETEHQVVTTVLHSMYLFSFQFLSLFWPRLHFWAVCQEFLRFLSSPEKTRGPNMPSQLARWRHCPDTAWLALLKINTLRTYMGRGP